MSEERFYSELIRGLRTGDSLAEKQFFEQYGPMLENLADRHLAGGMRRRFGPDDVALSACRTFMRRARLGEFELPDAASLWRLLAAITLAKLREQVRYHKRQRRSVGQEVSFQRQSEDESPSAFHPIDPEATPLSGAAFADEFEQLVGSLEEEEKRIVDLKLQDRSNAEIAAELSCSERTVRRILSRLKSRFERTLGGD
jgi:RNA polymerase sigma factor (sigma-70 family)